MKIHGQAWNKLASVRTMSSSRDDADIRLARRIADAVAAGERDEAVRLTRELEWALTNMPDPSARAAPSFTAQPAVVPMTYTPAPSLCARQVIAGALAEIGVACRAQVATDYAEARFGQRIEPRTLAAFASALTTTDTAVSARPHHRSEQSQHPSSRLRARNPKGSRPRLPRPPTSPATAHRPHRPASGIAPGTSSCPPSG